MSIEVGVDRAHIPPVIAVLLGAARYDIVGKVVDAASTLGNENQNNITAQIGRAHV